MTAAIILAMTLVWGFYGFGDNFFGTSAGIDQIAATARTIPHVAQVRILPWWAKQQAVNEIVAAPHHAAVVLYGYSCGANGVTDVAQAFRHARHIDIAGIQPSVWCRGSEVFSNVQHAQYTHSPCVLNFGLGCGRFVRAAGNTTTHVEDIRRVRLHIFADLDPGAQADVLRLIARDARR